MDLVNELQISAEQDDVLTVLRKARRLASKLGVNSIDEWLESEQNGYKNRDSIPSYRRLVGTLAFKTNGPVPYGFGKLVNGVLPFAEETTIPQLVHDSMAEINAIVKSNSKGDIYFIAPNPEVLRRCFDGRMADQFTFMVKVSRSQYTAIPDKVKDRVLNWACELERNNILGEGMSFNSDERSRAGAITWNIYDSSIGQLNNMGHNHSGATR